MDDAKTDGLTRKAAQRSSLAFDETDLRLKGIEERPASLEEERTSVLDDSDLIHPDQVPADMPLSQPRVTDETVKPIFDAQLHRVHEKILETLKIPQDDVLELA